MNSSPEKERPSSQAGDVRRVTGFGEYTATRAFEWKVPEEAEPVEYFLERIAEWEKAKDGARLLELAIVEGGVIERRACEALKKLGKKGIDACRQVLDDHEALPFYKFSTARILGVIGSSRQVDELVKALGHESPAVRRGAAEGLGYAGSKKAVPALVGVLDSDDAPLRRAAADALRKLGDKKAAKAIVGLLDDRIPNVRRSAVLALAELDGKGYAEQIIEHVKDPDRSVRRAMVQGLVKIDDESIVEPMLRLSRDREVDVRHEAVRHLDLVAKFDRAAVDRLIEALSDRSNEVRRAAAEALMRLKDTRAVKALTDLLRDGPERLSQILAAKALGEIGDPAAVPRLAHALLVEDFNLQDAAQEALTKILGQVDLDAIRAQAHVDLEKWNKLLEFGAGALDPLVKLLKNRDNTVMANRLRSHAATILGKLGAMGEKAVIQPLVELLDEQDPKVKQTAAKALAEIGDPSVAPKLAALLDSPDPSLREAAIVALGTIGDPSSLPRLVEIARDCDEFDLRVAAVGALAGFGAGGLQAIEEFIEGGVDVQLRLAAVRALVRAGTPLAVDLLIQALGDAVPGVRFEASEGLERYGWAPVGLRTRRTDAGYARWTARSEWTTSTEPVDQVEVLVEGLEHGDPAMRRAAAEALGDLGDRRAVEALTKHLGDQDVDVAAVAGQALVALGVEPESGDSRWVPYWVSVLDAGEILAAGDAAVPALESELWSQDPERRVEVVRLLGEIGSKACVPALFRALGDLDDEVVRAALAALRAMGEDEVGAHFKRYRKKAEQAEQVQGLVPLVGHQDREVRYWAAVALARLEHQDSTDVLARLLHDPWLPVVLIAVHTIGRRRVVGLVDELVELLGAAIDQEIRFAVMDALAQIGDERATAALARFLLYPSDDLVSAAKASLKKLLGKKYHEDEVKALAFLLNEDWDALVELGAPATKFLVDILQDREMNPLQTKLRRSAAITLGRIGGPGVRELLEAELGDPQPTVRAGVALGLGELGDQGAIPAVRPLLVDRDPEVREAAVRALGMLDAKEDAEAIGELYRDEADGVKDAVVETLGRLGVPAIMTIVEILEGGDPETKVRAARALGKIGHVKAISYLENALGDSDYHVRQAARQAMLRLGWMPVDVCSKATDEKPSRLSRRSEWVEEGEEISQVEALRRGLQADVSLRRRVAASALAELGDVDSVPLIEPLLDDPDVHTRMIAAKALAKLGVEPKVDDRWAPYWAVTGRWDECVEIGAAAVEPLVAMLESKFPAVRLGAAQALARIGDPRAMDGLGRLLSDEAPKVRSVAVSAIAGMASKDAVAMLSDAFDAQADPTVRLEILKAVTRAGANLARDLVQKAAGDPATMVSTVAKELLEKMGG